MSVAGNTTLYGIVAEFDSPQAIFHACEETREAGYRKWDAYTPFPVHGLERAMGLRASRVPWWTFILALTGLAAGLLLEWWTSAVDYPVVIAGKPYFSLPAFVPVAFELAILFGALGTFFGMLFYNRLPEHYHPIFFAERFVRVSDDRFFVAVEAADPKFDAAATMRFFRELGAMSVELVEEPKA
ncbi:MAG: DUF3341 domain-containing protein [Myxococcota bacterium]